MINAKNFSNVIDFISFFFCQTFSRDMYADQVKLYNTLSSREERNQLKNELVLLREKYSWEDIKWFMDKHCEKRPKDEASVNFIIQTILNNLE